MIETIIKHIMSTIPATDENICMDDVYHYFCDSPAWSKAAVFKRDDSSCLLELKGIAAPGISSIHDLRRFQYQIWHDISYPYFETSAIALYKEASVMRFISAHTSKSCFTGRMIIGGEYYYKLVGSRLARLPKAPFPIDFTDMEESVHFVEESRARNELARENEHRQRVLLAIQTVEKIKQYTSTCTEENMKSEQLRDALVFNLQQLYSQSLHFHLRKYAGIKEWRDRLRVVYGILRNPGSLDSSVVWSIAFTEAPEFLKLISATPGD